LLYNVGYIQISGQHERKAARLHPVNVFGRINGEGRVFGYIEDGQKIIIEKAEL
jgi:hypothetical protein